MARALNVRLEEATINTYCRAAVNLAPDLVAVARRDTFGLGDVLDDKRAMESATSETAHAFVRACVLMARGRRASSAPWTVEDAWTDLSSSSAMEIKTVAKRLRVALPEKAGEDFNLAAVSLAMRYLNIRETGGITSRPSISE